MTGMTPERLAEIRDRATWATEGPWAPWLDQDGQPHMGGMLMVGNAAAVIPEGETWVEGVDVNPIAHTYTPEDRRFIAHARTDVPELLAEVERLRAEIEALVEEWRDSTAAHPDCGIDEDCVGCAASELTALLNPPTEGETDDR